MKKLLIASLVLGMLIVFSGEASAQNWFMSQPITTSIPYDYETVNATGNTVIATATLTFKGYMVMETAVDTAVGYPIVQMFLCGILYKGSSEVCPLLIQCAQPNITAVSTDYVKLSKVKHKEHSIITGTGTFTDQSTTPITTSNSGYLKASASFSEDASDTITSIAVVVEFDAGYAQGAPKTGSFEGDFSTELKPYTLPTGDTTLICVDGVVTPSP